MDNPTIYSDGVLNSIQDSPLRVQNKILGALKNMGGTSLTISSDVIYAANTTGQAALGTNTARKFFSIQNIGTKRVYIRFGSAVVTEADDAANPRFSYILSPASGDYEGDGGVLTVEGYTGSVYIKTASGTSKVIATDFT
jgi:hypothetical protein